MREWVRIVVPPLVAALLTGFMSYVAVRVAIAELQGQVKRIEDVQRERNESLSWRLNRIETRLDRLDERTFQVK